MSDTDATGLRDQFAGFARRAIPFCFLDPDQQARVEEAASIARYGAGDAVTRVEYPDDNVYVVLDGEVQVVDPRGVLDPTSRFIGAGHYFGERRALLGHPAVFDVVAREDSVCAKIPAATFLDVTAESASFRRALATVLRDKQGIFFAFDEFMAELMHGAAELRFDMREIVRRYRALRPSLHRHVGGSAIDVGALAYAMRRLPVNIGRTLALFLTNDFPQLYEPMSGRFLEVSTAARRRAVFEMMPGKSMVLLRDSVSDLADFITCLCVWVAEAEKIRARLDHPDAIELLERSASGEESSDDALAKLALDEAEAAGLRALWGDDTVQHLRAAVLHNEDYYVEIEPQFDNYGRRHSESWTLQIAEATAHLMGCDPARLPPDLPVHIISSNTHSVANCLSPWLHRHRREVEAWGRTHTPDLFEARWSDDTDRLYAVARSYLEAHPALAKQRAKEESGCGMYRLPESAITGIAVELIDLSRLNEADVDPGIVDGGKLRLKRGLLVNIDYAFGRQAKEILSCLLTLFGRRVRSVNVLGKAGAVIGARGDILVPTVFVEQGVDEAVDFPGVNDVEVERLHARTPDRGIHVGPVLTVAGTLLQNDSLLRYYKHIWQCVGLEMEGTYYLRELLTAARTGVVSDTVKSRFLYYVSDLPLDHSANLSGSLQVHEGLPPLYAVTREVLAEILA